MVNDRNIMVTISAEQKIKMKLKSMKSGEVEISIEELYSLMTNNTNKIENTEKKPIVKEKGIAIINDKDLISIHDFRSQYLISTDFDLTTKVKLEAITTKLINNK